MIILDCESLDSTYVSFENIFGICRKEIEKFFQNIDIETIYESKNSPEISANEYLLKNFEEKFPLKKYIGSTSWFHATRTTKDNKFLRGILPLNEAIDDIWKFLYSLIKGKLLEEKWFKFKNNIENIYDCHFAELYRNKVNCSTHWGSYAFLIKEVIFKFDEIGNHNYLSTPEIVEDICICFKKEFDIELLELFQKNTKPCIVKFITEGLDRADIKAAMMYAYSKFYDNKLSILSNSCSDGSGSKVLHKNILSIEYPIVA